jgi:hypothetical protein
MTIRASGTTLTLARRTGVCLAGEFNCGVEIVRRVMLLAGLPCVSAFVGTLLAIAVALPTFVEAQETRMRADAWNLTGTDDKDRVRLTTGPLGAAAVSVLSTDGVIRTQLATGGQPSVVGAEAAGRSAIAAGFNLNAPDGTRLGRLGTVDTQSEYSGVNIYLNDAQGRRRLILRVDENGNPSIEFFDADGNVTWSQR